MAEVAEVENRRAPADDLSRQPKADYKTASVGLIRGVFAALELPPDYFPEYRGAQVLAWITSDAKVRNQVYRQPKRTSACFAQVTFPSLHQERVAQRRPRARAPDTEQAQKRYPTCSTGARSSGTSPPQRVCRTQVLGRSLLLGDLRQVCHDLESQSLGGVRSTKT